MSNLFVHHFNAIVELRHLLSVTLACICGYAIGYERKAHNKQAGIKTHIIVALTATLMMILSKEAFLDTPEYDTSRIAAQIVSGISFIGGGIIFMRDKRVSGITTTAGIWATAGIGMAIGAGFWILGTLCSVIVVVIQLLTHKSNPKVNHYHLKLILDIPTIDTIDVLYSQLESFYLGVSLDVLKTGEHTEMTYRIDHDHPIIVDDVTKLFTENHLDFNLKNIVLKTT